MIKNLNLNGFKRLYFLFCVEFIEDVFLLLKIDEIKKLNGSLTDK